MKQMKQIQNTGLLFILIVLFTLSSCVKNEITDVKLSKSTISINVGQSDSVIATVTLTGDLNAQPLSWNAGNAEIVSINESATDNSSKSGGDGTFTKTLIITALKEGTTNITVQAGNKTSTCEIIVNQTNYTFNQAYTSNWGDYYETGNNSFDMYLLENTLSVDSAGALSGNGTLLYIDFSVAITQNMMNEGNFTLTNTGAVNTFFPGEYVESDGQTAVKGTHIITINQTTAIATLVKDGHYSVSSKGENFLIVGDLITENNEVVHFSYEGPVAVKDQREVPVEIYPVFTKGELVFYGDAYKSGISNNFVAYLASESVNFEDTVLNGEILMLELNTALTDTTFIHDGTYNMMPLLTIENLVPNSLVLGYSTENGENWGCWYYGETTKQLRTGNVTVSRTDDQYTINYLLYDKIGSKVSGTFTGPLKYLNGMSTNSATVAAARVKSNKQAVKSFSKIQQKATKTKTFRFKL